MNHPLASDLDSVISGVGALWEELRGARLFITGGTGFFGTWLLESLAWANDQLGLNASAVILSRDPARFAAKAPHLASRGDLSFVSGDVNQFQDPAGEFSHVIHAATDAVNQHDPLRLSDTIVLGTRRVLEFAGAHGVRRLLFTSSGAVYGQQPPDLTHVPEDFPGAPDPTDVGAAYGQSKRLAELLCAAWSQRSTLTCTIARCFAFVGPHLPLDAHFAIGNFIGDALAGREIVVRGDGTAVRSYLYAADLAVWLWTILLRGKPARAYNTGSDQALTIGELARLVAQQAGGLSVRIMKPSVPGAPAARYVPNIQRAGDELGLTPTTSLVEAIRRTIAFHRVQTR